MRYIQKVVPDLVILFFSALDIVKSSMAKSTHFPISNFL